MGMREAIENFNQQFAFEPKIEFEEKFKRKKKFLLVGMGGSHLAAGLLKIFKPELDIILHRDYGLPKIGDKNLRERTIILSSYSGNTEEVISAYKEAKRRKLNLISISTDGDLLKLAKKDKTPYIQMPATGIQPRCALGFSFKSFLKAVGEKEALKKVSRLKDELEPKKFENKGKRLAEILEGSIPIIYSSTKNKSLAYIWKIKFNETGKIPAFFNVFPELNHNEMTGFDVKDTTFNLSKNFFFIFLRDKDDGPKIKKRMEVLAKLFKKRKLRVEIIELKGKNIFLKIFSSLLIADWASFYLAQKYKVEAEKVPMVEEFKKLIK